MIAAPALPVKAAGRPALVSARGSLAMRLRHAPEVERLVDDGFLDAGLPCDLAQRPTRRRRLLHEFGRAVVADVWIERGRRGQRQLRVALALLPIRLDAVDALLRE